MNGGEVDNRSRFGSPKSPMNFIGESSFESNSPLMKSQMADSSQPSPRNGDSVKSHRTRRDANQFKESTRAVDSVKARVETELSDAKKTVRDLALKIEEANSRAKVMQNQRKPKWREEEESDPTIKIDKEDTNNNYQYADVMKELEQIKQELSKLKLDMALVLEEKRRAEKTSEASSSRMWSYSSSVEAMKREIQELNEEQLLVELAQIEAAKEFEAIEAQRKEEANHYTAKVDETRKKVNEIIAENDRAKELQKTLAVKLSDVNLLERELAMAKEMDKRVERTESMRRMEGSIGKDGEGYSPSLLKSISEELEAAKIELATVKREGFNFMASMDVIRNELNHVREERTRLEKAEEKRDSTVQNLNSKILRATSKLVALASVEEKATTVASNLSHTLEQLRAEAEAAKKEKEIITEEIANITVEIPKTESEIELAEERLEVAMQELKSVKSSESTALEKLKNLIETTVKARELTSQHSSTITISKFEYEYLIGQAGGAEEIADKKVAAAQAWVEALKANEKEILMKAEMAQREIREQSVAEEAEAEVEWGQNGEKKLPLEIASPRKAVYRIGNTTPVRRARLSKLRSPATRHVAKLGSFTVKRREKVMPNLARFFGNKNIEKDH